MSFPSLRRHWRTLRRHFLPRGNHVSLTLQGRWAVVTGASSGLGLEIAKHLAHHHKANLVLVARRLDRLEALRDELKSKAGVDAVALKADMSSDEECRQMFQASV